MPTEPGSPTHSSSPTNPALPTDRSALNNALDLALDVALTAALRPPATPPNLRAAVMAAVAREPVVDWQAHHEQLRAEHRAAITALNARYIRHCRDALLAGSTIVMTSGLAVHPLTHWLSKWLSQIPEPTTAGASILGTPVIASIAAGLLALTLGTLLGAFLITDVFRSSTRRSST